jgi:beta-glucanase (GH16 family)
LVLAKLNIDPAELIEKAKTEPNAATRANQMQVYINSSAAEPLPQAWAFNNAAHIYLAQCNFRQSSELAKSALKASDELQASSPELSNEMRKVRALSAWTAAISAGQLGQSKEAERFRDIAIKNGSANAASVPLPTPKTRCIPGKVKLRPPAVDLRRS